VRAGSFFMPIRAWDHSHWAPLAALDAPCKANYNPALSVLGLRQARQSLNLGDRKGIHPEGRAQGNPSQHGQ
jgi:hypothetical protein